MDQYCYKLGDGRIWSTEAAAWIKAKDVPAGTVLNRLHQNGQPAGIDYLRAVLEEYGYDFGELAGEEKAGQ